MNSTKSKAVKIEKEEVDSLHFPKESVILDKASEATLKIYLDNALTLGNLEHSKVKIFFEDSLGSKYVETTVWSVSDKNISLKKEVHIPIHRIHYIELI
ncbi:MAG: hypothetical protein ACI8ZO_000441 [Flavobacteriales bacterium]|jgi:hypothetical protein